MTFPQHWFKPAAATLCGGLLFLGGCDDKKSGESPAPGVPAAAVSATATSFDEVAARLDKGGTFYAYLSTAQWLDGLSGRVSEWRDLVFSAVPKDQMTPKERDEVTQAFNLGAALIKQSGLEQISGVGASSIALGPGVNRNTFFIHHYKGKDTGMLGAAFGAAPHALAALDLLPANTSVASYGDFDVAQIIARLRTLLEQSGIPEVRQGIDQGLAQFTAAAGMPLEKALGSLGGAGGLVITLDPAKPMEIPMGAASVTIQTPRLALLVEVKDDLIFNRLEQVIGGMVPKLVKVDEPGLRMRTMAMPATPDYTARLTVAQWDKLFIIASDDQLIREMIATKKSGGGLKSSPAFAGLAAGMPTEGNGFSVVMPSFGDTIRRVQLEMMNNQPGSSPQQTQLMQKLLSGGGATSVAYTVSSHVDNGWLTISKGSQGVNEMLLPLAVVPAGIMAGIALPVFNSVQLKGKATKSLSQAKQIGLACKLYAGDNDGKFPPTLDALIPTYTSNEKLFVSPFAPDEPMGYTYHAGLTDDSPPDTVLIEDKFSGKEHQRVVVHVDCSGEVTKVP